MKHTRVVVVAGMAVAAALGAAFINIQAAGAQADQQAALAATNAPPNGVWVDSLDLSKAPLRGSPRPRGRRGWTGRPRRRRPISRSRPQPSLSAARRIRTRCPSSASTAIIRSRSQRQGDEVHVAGRDRRRFPQGAAASIFGVWVDGKKVVGLGRDEGRRRDRSSSPRISPRARTSSRSPSSTRTTARPTTRPIGAAR